MTEIKATPSHYPLIYPAARKLGVAQSTLYRALKGSFPNPALVKGYRQFVLDYLDTITRTPSSTSSREDRRDGPSSSGATRAADASPADRSAVRPSSEATSKAQS